MILNPFLLPVTRNKNKLILPTSGLSVDEFGYLSLNPVLESELFSNIGFEIDTSWTKGAGWTIAGGKAVATAATGLLTQSLTSNPFDYVMEFDLTRTAGTARPTAGGNFGVGLTIDGHYRVSTANNGSSNFGIGVIANFTGTIDNFSCKKVTVNKDFTIIKTLPNQIGVRLPTFVDNNTYNLTMYKNSHEGYTSYIQARLSSTVGTACRVNLQKIVNGTVTNLISFTSVTFVSNALFEIRRLSNNVFQMWYNGSQVGTGQTISDSEIISNSYHGFRLLTSDWLTSEIQINNLTVPF